jgi:hypothetical protein
MMTAILIRALECIFALGLLGSGVVLLLTLVEDAKMLVEKDEGAHNVIGEAHGTSPIAVR